MKLTQWLLLAFLGVLSTAKGQIVPLFNIEFDSTCVPYTPLGNRFIINDALTYSWNFGNGTVINQKMPTYSYTQAGAFKLSLNITTNASDKMVNGLTITAIPSHWDDRGTKDVKPDIFFVIRDSSEAIIFKSNIITDLFPPIAFTTNFLIKTGRIYYVDMWEYDDTGGDDFLCTIPITNSSVTNTFSSRGGTVVLASLTNNTNYTYSRDIRLYNQPTVKIKYANDILSSVITGGVGGYYYYEWRLNDTIVSYESTYKPKPTQNGTYKLFVTNSKCSATDTLRIRVASHDIPTLQNIRLFPTPSVSNEKQTLSFSSIESKTVDLMVSDISGKTLSRQTLKVVVGENTFYLPETRVKGMFLVYLLDKNKTIFFEKTAVF